MSNEPPYFPRIAHISDCTDSPGRDAIPSQQCWYSFAAEYTEANGWLMKLSKLQKRTMPSVGIEPRTPESNPLNNRPQPIPPLGDEGEQ